MKRLFEIRHLLLLLAIALLFGCDQQSNSSLPTVTVTIGKKQYTLEVAARDAQREHGLMQRDSMPDDHGMIFVFADAQPRNFWMKNTRIPLDIVYVDAAASVISIHHMNAYKLDSVPSDGAAQYAIELNAGQAADSGVKPGDKLQLPDPVKNAKPD